MLLPAFSPDRFTPYSFADSDEDLFNKLVIDPIALVLFFEYASDDETWSDLHSTFMQTAIEWFSQRTLNNRLSSESILLVANSIQKHYQNLKSYIPNDISFSVEGLDIPVNNLLWSARSEFFNRLIHQTSDGKVNKILLDNLTFDWFILIDEYMRTGVVADLWKHDKQEIILFLKKITNFQVPGLMIQSEDVLKRYLNRDNVFDTLKMAYKESWNQLQKHCCDFINHLSLGIHLSTVEGKDIQDRHSLALEFYNFEMPALDAFDLLKDLITHLICSGSLSEAAEFSQIVSSCPKLVSLDVSGSFSFSDRLLELPSRLQELDLSTCVWLTSPYLQRIVEASPQLKKLKLSSNVQLNFTAWTVLQKLRELVGLDLARCNQITDEDLRLILKTCRNLIELNLEECIKLSEGIFYELAKNMPQLTALNVSRSNVTDGAVAEIAIRCSSLQYLDLTRCQQVTEKGIIQLLRQAPSLQNLIIRSCPISDKGIEFIRQLRPFTNIVTSSQ
jgi:F-box and leucine-rich repeat protein 2/20